MSRGGKEEIVLSEEIQRDLELYCLNRDLSIYKSFANKIASMLKLNGKEQFDILKTEADIGCLNYVVNLLEKEMQ
ncbi:hypothetical protein HYV49_01095 [Candidatus Pacearchaeota archaeon]|nr:hypothetical protein [Candidatus Pacearchaeota archaeon]